MEQLQRNVLTLHIKQMKNTSTFDLRSSSGVRRGIEDEDLRSKALVFFIFFMCKVSTFLWTYSVLSTSQAVVDSFLIQP